MKKFILFTFILGCFSSCEKYTTNISDLTLSGKYVVSKLQVIQTSNPTSRDTTYLGNQIFVNNSLPDPFDSIRVNNFYIHFTYTNVMIDWLGNDRFSGYEIWKYGQDRSEPIFYERISWTYNAYELGKIRFRYIPTNKGVSFPVILQIDSDQAESLQISGFEFAPNGPNGTRYRLILSLTRVGP